MPCLKVTLFNTFFFLFLLKAGTEALNVRFSKQTKYPKVSFLCRMTFKCFFYFFGKDFLFIGEKLAEQVVIEKVLQVILL